MNPPSAALSHRFCAFCPSLCRFSCPVEEVAGRETASPRFMVSLGGNLKVGALHWTPSLAQAVTACDGCGACSEVCEHDVPVASLLREARAEAKRHTSMPRDYGHVAESLAAGHGPGGKFLDKAYADLTTDRIGREATWMVWPSDRGLELGADSLTKTLGFLDALGVDYALPSPEKLTPSPRWARILGATNLAKDLLRKLQMSLKNVSKVFCEDPNDLALLEELGLEGVTYWDLAPPQGLSLPKGGEFFLSGHRDDPGLEELGASLGLKPLLGARGLRVSPGAAEMFDLLQPKLAEAMREKALERASGAPVLLPSEALCRFWEAGGGRARRLSELRPRERL